LFFATHGFLIFGFLAVFLQLDALPVANQPNVASRGRTAGQFNVVSGMLSITGLLKHTRKILFILLLLSIEEG